MQGFFPRIHRVCNRDDVSDGCSDRLRAEDWGDFYPDFEAWGWVMADTPLRYMSDQAFHETYIHRRDYKHVNHTGRPYIWVECPFCQQPLPSMGAVRKARGETA